MRDRIKNLIFREAASQARTTDGIALSPVDPGSRVLFVYALERKAEAFVSAFAPLRRRFWRHKIVFLTTDQNFRPFMEGKAVFEQLPALEQIAAFPDLMNWPRYLEDRHALLHAKWRPHRAIAYGMPFATYVNTAKDLVSHDNSIAHDR